MNFEKEKTFIIAEAGVNHNGHIEIAKKLVDAACEAGADAVKFQTFNAERLVCGNAPKAEYQIENTNGNENQLEMLKRLQLSEEEFRELQAYCELKGIMFLSTPFDVESLKFIRSLGVEAIKIPSGEVTNYPLLREAGKSALSIILSTGMCSINEVKAAVAVLNEYGATKITVLQCNTEYPTPYADANLNAMLTLGKETGCAYGYSDHTLGNEVALAAVAMGARIIEKHFTLDRNMEGPDHRASIVPSELKALVTSIRHIESAMGVATKKMTDSERKNLDIVRKSIVTKCTIKRGELFSEANLTTKRPGNGVSPMRWNEVIGKTANRDYEEDELIDKF